MRSLSEEHLGRFHHGLGEGRVRMNRQLHVGGGRAHLDGEHALGDQLARARARRCRRPARARWRDRSAAWSCRRRGRWRWPGRRPPHGNRATSTLMPCFSASASVSPAHAISGSVKTTAGIAAGSNTALCPAMASTATRASCDALCASIGSPATSPIANIVGSAVRRWPSVSMKPLASTFTRVLVEPVDVGVRPAADRDQHVVVGGAPSGAPSPSKVTVTLDVVAPSST